MDGTYTDDLAVTNPYPPKKGAITRSQSRVVKRFLDADEYSQPPPKKEKLEITPESSPLKTPEPTPPSSQEPEEPVPRPAAESTTKPAAEEMLSESEEPSIGQPLFEKSNEPIIHKEVEFHEATYSLVTDAMAYGNLAPGPFNLTCEIPNGSSVPAVQSQAARRRELYTVESVIESYTDHMTYPDTSTRDEVINNWLADEVKWIQANQEGTQEWRTELKAKFEYLKNLEHASLCTLEVYEDGTEKRKTEIEWLKGQVERICSMNTAQLTDCAPSDAMMMLYIRDKVVTNYPDAVFVDTVQIKKFNSAIKRGTGSERRHEVHSNMLYAYGDQKWPEVFSSLHDFADSIRELCQCNLIKLPLKCHLYRLLHLLRTRVFFKKANNELAPHKVPDIISRMSHCLGTFPCSLSDLKLLAEFQEEYDSMKSSAANNHKLYTPETMYEAKRSIDMFQKRLALPKNRSAILAERVNKMLMDRHDVHTYDQCEEIEQYYRDYQTLRIEGYAVPAQLMSDIELLNALGKSARKKIQVDRRFERNKQNLQDYHDYGVPRTLDQATMLFSIVQEYRVLCYVRKYTPEEKCQFDAIMANYEEYDMQVKSDNGSESDDSELPPSGILPEQKPLANLLSSELKDLYTSYNNKEYSWPNTEHDYLKLIAAMEKFTDLKELFELDKDMKRMHSNMGTRVERYNVTKRIRENDFKRRADYNRKRLKSKSKTEFKAQFKARVQSIVEQIKESKTAKKDDVPTVDSALEDAAIKVGSSIVALQENLQENLQAQKPAVSAVMVTVSDTDSEPEPKKAAKMRADSPPDNVSASIGLDNVDDIVDMFKPNTGCTVPGCSKECNHHLDNDAIKATTSDTNDLTCEHEDKWAPEKQMKYANGDLV